MTTLVFEGKEIKLTQEPYITGTNESPNYEAVGVDSNGNEVTVKWAIYPHWLNEDGTLNGELEDETEACDWDNPIAVEGMKVYMKHVDTGAILTLEEWKEKGIREFTEIFNSDEQLKEEFVSLQAYLEHEENRGNMYCDLVECDKDGNKIDYIAE